MSYLAVFVAISLTVNMGKPAQFKKLPTAEYPSNK